MTTRPLTPLPLTGGCQCGGLRYRIDQAPITVVSCHCTNCQRISGAAFSTNAFVREEGFSFTTGQPGRHEWNADSGKRRFGWFCPDCGTRIAHGYSPSNGAFGVRGGTLDDTSWLEPVADIWVRSAQPWVRTGADRPAYAMGAPDFAELVAAFGRQGRFSA